jgi:hypothetical protein
MKKILLSAIAMLLLLSSVAIFASCSDDSTDDTYVSVSSDGETDTEGTSSESTNDSTTNTDNDGETTTDTTETESSAVTTGGEQWSQDRK